MNILDIHSRVKCVPSTKNGRFELLKNLHALTAMVCSHWAGLGQGTGVNRWYDTACKPPHNLHLDQDEGCDLLSPISGRCSVMFTFSVGISVQLAVTNYQCTLGYKCECKYFTDWEVVSPQWNKQLCKSWL